MDDIRFSIVKASSEEFQAIFYKAISWDKKHTFFTSKMPDYDSMFPIMDILETIVICYKDDKPIGYGEIFTEFNVDGIQLLLSYIIDPEYRKKGYGTKLVKQLLILCEEKYKNINAKVKVKILKKNLPSISLIENLDFDFDYFNDKEIVFKKSL